MLINWRLALSTVLILNHGYVFAGAKVTSPQASTKTVTKTARAPMTFMTEAQAAQNVVFPSKKMKISEFIKHLEGKVPAPYLAVMKEKAKSVQNETMEFEKLGGAKFALRANGSEALVEVVNFADGKFKINNRVATIDFKSKPQFLWEDIQKLLVKPTAMNPIMLLLVPEAHAFFDGFWPIAIGVGVAGIGLWMYNSMNCEKYKTYQARCASASCGDMDLYTEMRSHDTGWLNLSMGCDNEKLAVRSCLNTLQTCGSSGAQESGVLNGYGSPAGAVQ